MSEEKRKKPMILKTLIGVVLGAVAGFAYYRFVGCVSGTCPITSSPVGSTLYGALLGGVLFSGFR